VYFMENAIAPWTLPGLRSGLLAIPLSADLPLPQVAVGDIAAFSVAAIEKPERTTGKRINIAGDLVTGIRSAAVLSAASGRTIEYLPVPVDQIRQSSEDLALMFEWFESNRPEVDIAALHETFPDAGWRTYPQWAGQQDWP